MTCCMVVMETLRLVLTSTHACEPELEAATGTVCVWGGLGPSTALMSVPVWAAVGKLLYFSDVAFEMSHTSPQ